MKGTRGAKDMERHKEREGYEGHKVCEGQMVYSTVLTTWMVVGMSPKPPPMLVDMSAGMWIKKSQL